MERILTLRKVFARTGVRAQRDLVAKITSARDIEGRRSEPWNHWGHYWRPGHHHFGDSDPATDLAQPGREAASLRKFESFESCLVHS
jgi:hypothetical protein